MEEAKGGPMIKFRTSDDKEVAAPKDIVLQSVTIRAMLEENDGDSDEVIMLPEINEATFALVL